MNITLRQLEVFLAVIDTQSTTRGAEKLALSQSAVSSALADLENQLGVQLFERAGKRLIVNENARLLFPRAQALLEQAQELENLFSSGRSMLRIGASTTIGNYLLPAVIARYREQFPGIQLELRVANSADIAEAVANFDVDIGFIEGPCHRMELESQLWRQDEMLLFCAASHPLAGKTVTAEQLAECQWILREAGSGTREVVEQLLLPRLHHLNLVMELGNSEAIKHAVSHSQTVSCLSKVVIEEQLESGRVALLQLENMERMMRPLYLIRHKQKHQSRSLQVFLDVEQQIAAGLKA
ncbi:LysR family transcriptional regulator [Tolumonas osonensis]|uniref:DNA-binding transcriptional LysR family regulator n=1 Tax=Tolumonas osonensis TaxID=675874 RepID=A0A841GH19_9GAMM|nr:LysR family transcriptional regulator [Tolumonas osonensis]MBB6054180.1 DNA-binding transcriptional LysR family regulator [Tolumonas osonensis]